MASFRLLVSSPSTRLLVSGLCVLAACLSGCGGEDSNQVPTGGGQITDAWRNYCVAKFTTNYQVEDYGEVLFQARAGDEYLMSEYGESFGKDHAELLYLTAAGPETFSIDVTLGSREFPFTSNCTFDGATPYYAVFNDVTVYDSAELTNEVCKLSAGTVELRNTGAMAGFQTADSSLSFTGPTTYEIYLNAFSDQCGGAETGFVSVPQTQVLGTTTWLVPIRSIIGPS